MTTQAKTQKTCVLYIDDVSHPTLLQYAIRFFKKHRLTLTLIFFSRQYVKNETKPFYFGTLFKPTDRSFFT